MEHRHSSLPSPYPDPIKNPHSLIIDVAVRLVVGAGKHVPRPGLVSWSITWLSSPSRGNNENWMKWRMTYPWLQIICNRTRGHGGQQCWIGPKQNKSKNGNDNKDLTFLEWIDFLKYQLVRTSLENYRHGGKDSGSLFTIPTPDILASRLIKINMKKYL